MSGKYTVTFKPQSKKKRNIASKTKPYIVKEHAYRRVLGYTAPGHSTPPADDGAGFIDPAEDLVADEARYDDVAADDSNVPSQAQRPASETVHLPPASNHCSAAGNKQSERRAAEAERWQKGFRESSVQTYLENLESLLLVQQQIRAAVTTVIMQRAHQAQCHTCGMNSTSSAVTREVPVRVMLTDSSFTIKIPVFTCSRCTTATGRSTCFHVHPFAVACFPSTPVHGLQLWNVPVGMVPTWYQWGKLDLLYWQRQHLQRMGMQKAAEALQQVQLNQLPDSTWDGRMGFDQYRKTLSTALNEYAALQMALDEPTTVGAEQESIISVCPVCSQGCERFLHQQGVLHVRDGQPCLNAVSSPQHTPANTTDNAGHSSSHARSQQSAAKEPAATAPGVEACAQGCQQQPCATGTADAPSAPAGDNADSGNSAATDAMPANVVNNSSSSKNAPTALGQEQDTMAAAPQTTSSAGTHSCDATKSQHAAAPQMSACQPTLPGMLAGPMLPFRPPQKPIVIPAVYADGNRRLTHLAKAGTASRLIKPPVRSRMTADDYSKDFMSDPATGASGSKADPDPCHQFDADKQLGRTSEMFDINGIVTLQCRHGLLLLALNMPTGERWAYAILLLHVLLCLHNVWPYVFYYDINCRFAEHLRAWAACSSGWSAALLAWVMSMPCPLPPFHAHMHAASCMAKNSHKLVYAAGSGVGEPPEQFNRYMGQCAMPLQYAAQWVRTLWLEVHMKCWNRRKVRLLPSLLVSLGLRAADRQQQMLEKQESLAVDAIQNGLATEDEVVSWGQCSEVACASRDVNAGMTPLAQAAELHIRLEDMARTENDPLVPPELVTGDISRKAAISTLEKKLVVALREANVASADWHRRSNLLFKGVAELALFKVHSLQRHLEDLSADYTRTLHLQKKVAGDKRQEHRHLDATLERYRDVMKSEIGKLVAWQQQLLHYNRFLTNGSAVTGTLPASGLASSSNWHHLPQQELLHLTVTGEFPWDADDSTTESKRRSIQRKMSILALDIRAAQIDRQLVDFEIANFQSGMQQRCNRLEALISVATEELQHLLQRQDELLTTSNGETPDGQQYAQCCELQSCDLASTQQCARIIILRKRLSSLFQQQQQAEHLFGQYYAGDSAAAVAAVSVEQYVSPVGDGQGEDVAEADEDAGLESDVIDDDPVASQGWGTTAQQPAVNTGVDAAAGAEGAQASDEAASGVEAMQVEIGSGFRVLSGTLVNDPWGPDQKAPWEATDDTLAAYYDYLEEMHSLPGDQLVLGKHLTAEHMLRLGPAHSKFCMYNSGWLSDETINTIAAQLLQQQNVVNCHVFNSFFMSKLLFDNKWNVVYEQVRRWTLPSKLHIAGHGQPNILGCRLLMAPCNLFNSHWVLVVADLEQRNIMYLDPKVGMYDDNISKQVTDAMAEYIAAEALNKLGQSWDTHSWPVLCPGPGDIPQQPDSSSCGVYILTYATCLAAGVPLCHCKLTAHNLIATRAVFVDRIRAHPII